MHDEPKTPAERWEVEKHPDMLRVVEVGGGDVAEIDTSDMTEAEWDRAFADAHQIAASGEALAACRWIVAEVDDIDSYSGTASDTWENVAREMYRLAKAAVRKSEGL